MFKDISKTLMLGVSPPEFLKLCFLKPAPGGDSYWSPNTTTNSETSPSAYRFMFFRMFLPQLRKQTPSCLDFPRVEWGGI